MGQSFRGGVDSYFTAYIRGELEIKDQGWDQVWLLFYLNHSI